MATMMIVAMSMIFASCKKEKTDDPKDPTDIPLVYTLTVLSSNEEMGTVTGGGSYEVGTEVTLTATPTSEGYAFVKWSDENTDNPRTLTVTGNSELTAIFDYAAVDLGLPSGLKWATCNVGAANPEGYGNYYAWGEIATKETYEWSNYTLTTDGGTTFTKYNTTDGKTTLDLTDDAARANWGGKWRMPTDAEWTELRENCEWTLTSDYNGTGVAGRIVTSKTNSNSIFLPAAGCCINAFLYLAGDIGGYWSSSLYIDDPNYAWVVRFNSDGVYRDYYGRHVGLSVRGVLGE